jgi:hypothetical protein
MDAPFTWVVNMAQAQQAGEPNRRQPKNPGPNKFSHTPNTQFGMGDGYGTGQRAKVGKMRSGWGYEETPVSKLKKPPRSLA